MITNAFIIAIEDTNLPEEPSWVWAGSSGSGTRSGGRSKDGVDAGYERWSRPISGQRRLKR